MGFQCRRLLSDSDNSKSVPGPPCSSACKPSDGGSCEKECPDYCSVYCSNAIPPPHRMDKLLITTITVLSTTFFLFCCYAIFVGYFRYYRRSGRRLGEEEQRNETIQEDFLDEDHGPVIDHPIWYINTIGLNPSVISSITVCKYKSGDGLVEGTECSVCLNEFQEDETLRLLPKCSHAFHIPCIDTWLRSHTNCPMCRAPIVTDTARATPSSSETNSDNSSANEEARIGIPEDNGESDREMEAGDVELRNEGELEGVDNTRKRLEDLNEEEDGIQPMRRSVSLDSLSAFKISSALANVRSMESDQNSEMGNMEAVPKKIGRNQSLLKLMTGSSIGRSFQAGPSSIMRSFSCSGKLFLSRYGRNQNPVLPL